MRLPQLTNQAPSLSLSLKGARIDLRTSLIIVCALLGIACGADPAPRSKSSTRCSTSKTHPQSRFLTQEGHGVSIEEARRRASAELSRRLSAEVRSLVTVKSSQRNGEVKEEVDEEIEVSARFKHGELLRSISGCETCTGDRCQSVIALDRDELTARLLQGNEADIQTLARSAIDLTEETDLLRFTQAWRLAYAAHRRLQPTLNQLRVIGRSTRELEDAQEMMREAAKVRAKRQEQLWIDIKTPRIPDANPSTGEGLTHAFSTALDQIGLKRWDRGGCPEDRGVDVITISPHGALSCRLGLIGPQCELKLGVSVSRCLDGVEQDLTEADWSDLRVVGVHPREQRVALDQLAHSLKDLDLKAAITRTLAPFILL